MNLFEGFSTAGLVRFALSNGKRDGITKLVNGTLHVHEKIHPKSFDIRIILRKFQHDGILRMCLQ